MEGHTEFNPIRTSPAFPHSWFPGSNKEESSQHEDGKGGTKRILTLWQQGILYSIRPQRQDL